MGNHPAMDPPCRCGRPKSRDTSRVKLKQVHAGDVGMLIVRRPSKPRQVIDWRDVPL